MRSTQLPAVLLYHRVGAAAVDPWALAVSPQHFIEHLEVLAGRTVISLRDLLRMLKTGTSATGTLAITFDDGYAETVSIVQPLLERRGMGATFYLPTGALNSPREFWWDELEHLILISEHLPEHLSIEINGQQFDWRSAGEGHAGWTDEDRRRHRLWRAWEDPVPTSRHALYRALWERCQRLDAADRERVLRDVRVWCGGAQPARATHRALTTHEAYELARRPCVDIGAHTVTHPALAALPLREQRLEIESSKRGLQELSGQPVLTFAYPFGRRVDYTDETVSLVRTAGFEGACSNFNGAIVDGVDPFQLPRLFVQDWDGDELTRQLASLPHV